ncbi:hypothetical protein ACYCAX_19470 [Pseudomonas sp. MT3]
MKTALLTLASARPRMYRQAVAVNPATRIGVLNSKADTPPLSGFFVSAAWLHPSWAGRVWASQDAPAPSTGTPTRTVPLTLIGVRASGKINRFEGNTIMTKRRILTLNPSRARAAFHRACALAALRADSSLATRLARYNAHMERSRALDAANAGGTK